MAGAATFITYGPNSAAQGLQEAEAFNKKNDPLNNPAAYGSVPAPVMPQITGPAATASAIQSGTTVNNQLPGYGADLATVGKNISSDLAGTVPEDVMAMLDQQAAERGVSTGGATGAAYLKALGLTSLGLEQTGQQDLQSILSSLPGAAISQNPNFYPTSSQTLEAGQQNSIWAAAPNPAAAAAAGLAAAGAGYGVGAGSAGVRLPPTPTLNPPGGTPPTATATNPMNPFIGDNSNLPGSLIQNSDGTLSIVNPDGTTSDYQPQNFVSPQQAEADQGTPADAGGGDNSGG